MNRIVIELDEFRGVRRVLLELPTGERVDIPVAEVNYHVPLDDLPSADLTVLCPKLEVVNAR